MGGSVRRKAYGRLHAPSTHIVKSGINRFPRAEAAEYVTMRAARSLGIAASKVQLLPFEDQAALVVQRYDRVQAEDGTIVRLHQEDFCQATGRWRAAKYQNGGGPGFRELAEVIVRHSIGTDAERSIDLLTKAAAYNWVVAGTDAHAKNYSLLHAGTRVRLAPLYDVTSAGLLLDPARVTFKAKLAMKRGAEYRIRAITPSHLSRAAAEIGVSADFMLDLVTSYAQDVPDAFADAIDDTDGIIGAELKDRYLSAIQGHAAWVKNHAQAGTAVEPEGTSI